MERSADLGTRKGSVVIGILGKGRVFGCWSTLLDEPHTLMSSAASEKDTRVLVMKGTDLRDMISPLLIESMPAINFLNLIII